MVEQVLAKLAHLPLFLIYIIIGAGAAIENVIPPIPADTFVLLGSFMAARVYGNLWVVFLVTWLCNIASVAVVYFVADKYGPRFFEHRFGHFLINQNQMQQIGRFYDRYGVPAIFVSRFLPTLRAIVPVFAGVTHVRFLRMFAPVAVASGLWYAFVVYIGGRAGANWQALVHFFDDFSGVLGIVAAVVIILLAVWWWRSRKHKEV